MGRLLALATAVLLPAVAAAGGGAEVLAQLGRDSALFPADLRVVSSGVMPGGERLFVSGSFGADDEVTDALRLETLLGALDAAGLDGGVDVQIPDGSGGWRPLGGTQSVVPISGPPTPPPAVGASPLLRTLPLGGALLGKRIGLSAGHGFIDDGAGGWRTQRSRFDFQGCGACRGITEDFFTAELATRWVIPLLQRMGAEVVVMREPDHDLRTALVVDDGDPAYTETGTWNAGTSAGGYGDDYRTAAGGEDAAAHWALGSAPGLRHVSVRFREGQNRTSVADFTLAHAGGVTTFGVDQRRLGQLWLDLGPFWLDADSRLSLTPGSGDGFLVADAVKVGGGPWASSSKPWWQMAAKSYVTWSGAPAAVTALGDVTIRPSHAEYAGVDLYVSLHANASGVSGGSSANGLSIYRYSCQQFADHSQSDAATGCDYPAGSKALIDVTHQSIMDRIRADWDAAFGDRSTRVANFGELRALDDAPGILVETAFFDNLASPSGSPAPRHADNRTLHDPRWREAFAYGLAEGIAKFVSPGAGAPPARPRGLRALNQDDGSLAVDWTPIAGALGYRVYVAAAGRAFDEGPLVTDPAVRLDALTTGEVYAVRVSALNANGEGFASEAVVARYRGPDLDVPISTLVVSGYDRRDAWVQETDNDLLHAVDHGVALGAVATADIYFDGVLDEAASSLTFGDYLLFDFALLRRRGRLADPLGPEARGLGSGIQVVIEQEAHALGEGNRGIQETGGIAGPIRMPPRKPLRREEGHLAASVRANRDHEATPLGRSPNDRDRCPGGPQRQFVDCEDRIVQRQPERQERGRCRVRSRLRREQHARDIGIQTSRLEVHLGAGRWAKALTPLGVSRRSSPTSLPTGGFRSLG